MCKNKECPLKDECYRFTAKPDEHQCYASFPHNEKCEYFIDNKDRINNKGLR